MPNLTAKSLSFNRNGDGGSNNARASRRHSRIINSDPRTLIASNLRPRAKAEQWAANVTFIEAALCISRLDQILSRPRRGPRAVKHNNKP